MFLALAITVAVQAADQRSVDAAAADTATSAGAASFAELANVAVDDRRCQAMLAVAADLRTVRSRYRQEWSALAGIGRPDGDLPSPQFAAVADHAEVTETMLIRLTEEADLAAEKACG